MRHRKSGRKFGMDSSERGAMISNMVTSLMLHGQIRTTLAKAKELRRFAEQVITLGKKAPTAAQIEALSGAAKQQAAARRVHLIRRSTLVLENEAAVAKVFGEYAERFRTRPGGYTRVVKAGKRPGDRSDMAIIQLVEALDVAAEKVEAAPEPEEKPKAKKPKAKKPAAEPEATETKPETPAE